MWCPGGWIKRIGIEAESWIIVTKHVRIMNLCFKNLGIKNLCTSARESWITRLWEKLNKIHVWINCVRSRECRIWRLRESSFQKFFRGTCPRTPLYNSCIRGWQSACFSNNLVLNVQLQKNSMPSQNEWWYQVWMKQKFEHQRIQNETKLPPSFLASRCFAAWHSRARALPSLNLSSLSKGSLCKNN